MRLEKNQISIKGHEAPKIGKVGLPPSNYPFETTLAQGQEATLHGNNRFINTTNQKLKLRIEFDLAKGYHIYVDAETTATHQYIQMNNTYRISLHDGELVLEKVEKKPSLRIFNMTASRV